MGMTKTANIIHLIAIGTVPTVPLSEGQARSGQTYTRRKRGATLVARGRDWQEIGRQAFLAGNDSTPWLNADVQEAVKDLPVGGGAAGIFRAFTVGWHEANLVAETVNA